MNQQKRIIIIHNHIFKNGGSTLDWALKRNFNKVFYDSLDHIEIKTWADYLERFVRDNESVVAISSHHVQFPLPKIDDLLFIPVQILRHPIERALSVYFFEKKQDPATTPGALFAKKHTLNEYVKWRLQDTVGATIRNFQCRKSGIPLKKRKLFDSAVPPLDAAIDFIRTNHCVGLLDQYDETMVLFEWYLRRWFPLLDLAYIPQNIGEHADKSIDEKIAYVKDHTEKAVYDLFCAKNASDIVLYEKAKVFFRERIERIPSFDALCRDYKARCRKIENSLAVNFMKVFLK